MSDRLNVAGVMAALPVTEIVEFAFANSMLPPLIRPEPGDEIGMLKLQADCVDDVKETAPVIGNCPSALAADSVRVTDADPLLGPVTVPDHVPAKDGMYWAWAVVEARAQVPPVITAVPLATC